MLLSILMVTCVIVDLWLPAASLPWWRAHNGFPSHQEGSHHPRRGISRHTYSLCRQRSSVSSGGSKMCPERRVGVGLSGCTVGDSRALLLGDVSRGRCMGTNSLQGIPDAKPAASGPSGFAMLCKGGRGPPTLLRVGSTGSRTVRQKSTVRTASSAAVRPVHAEL